LYAKGETVKLKHRKNLSEQGALTNCQAEKNEHLEKPSKQGHSHTIKCRKREKSWHRKKPSKRRSHAVKWCKVREKSWHRKKPS
jgi:hypothetical protein